MYGHKHADRRNSRAGLQPRLLHQFLLRHEIKQRVATTCREGCPPAVRCNSANNGSDRKHTVTFCHQPSSTNPARWFHPACNPCDWAHVSRLNSGKSITPAGECAKVNATALRQKETERYGFPDDWVFDTLREKTKIVAGRRDGPSCRQCGQTTESATPIPYMLWRRSQDHPSLAKTVADFFESEAPLYCLDLHLHIKNNLIKHGSLSFLMKNINFILAQAHGIIMLIFLIIHGTSFRWSALMLKIM